MWAPPFNSDRSISLQTTHTPVIWTKQFFNYVIIIINLPQTHKLNTHSFSFNVIIFQLQLKLQNMCSIIKMRFHTILIWITSPKHMNYIPIIIWNYIGDKLEKNRQVFLTSKEKSKFIFIDIQCVSFQ